MLELEKEAFKHVLSKEEIEKWIGDPVSYVPTLREESFRLYPAVETVRLLGQSRIVAALKLQRKQIVAAKEFAKGKLKQLTKGETEAFQAFTINRLRASNKSKVDEFINQRIPEGSSRDEVRLIIAKYQPQTEVIWAAGDAKQAKVDKQRREALAETNEKIRTFAKSLLNEQQWNLLCRSIVQSAIQSGSGNGEWGFYQIGIDITQRLGYKAFKEIYTNDEVEALGNDIVQDAMKQYLAKHIGEQRVNKLAGRLIRFDGPFSNGPAKRESDVFAKYTVMSTAPSKNLRRGRAE